MPAYHSPFDKPSAAHRLLSAELERAKLARLQHKVGEPNNQTADDGEAHPLAAYLDRAQLVHMHAQVAELTDRLQAAEQALQAARAELAEANTRADMWRCNVTNILAEAQEICDQLDGTQKDPTPGPQPSIDLKVLEKAMEPLQAAARAVLEATSAGVALRTCAEGGAA